MLRHGDGSNDWIIGRLRYNNGTDRHIRRAWRGDGTNNREFYRWVFTRGVLTPGRFVQGGGAGLTRYGFGHASLSTNSYGSLFGEPPVALYSQKRTDGYLHSVFIAGDVSSPVKLTINGADINAIRLSVDGGATWNDLPWGAYQTTSSSTITTYGIQDTLTGSDWPSTPGGASSDSPYSIIAEYAP